MGKILNNKYYLDLYDKKKIYELNGQYCLKWRWVVYGRKPEY